MKTVTCSYCGKQWQDDHPDLPGSIIWCGDCNRNGIIGVANKVVVEENQTRCAWKTSAGQVIQQWLPAGGYYYDGRESFSVQGVSHRAVVLISADRKNNTRYLVSEDFLAIVIAM